MTSTTQRDLDPGQFPQLKTMFTNFKPKSSKNARSSQDGHIYYGVYFYPYTKPGIDPVFAAVGGQEVLVARPHETKGIEIIRVFRDDVRRLHAFRSVPSAEYFFLQGFNGEIYCSACWAKDKETGDPLLVVAGCASVLKILNINTGVQERVLAGHGEDIMEIVTSPLDQNIVVTASADTTIRFWSIDRRHKKQPCFLMCAGEGHRETVLSVAFHATGHYLLSGGMDHAINLWVIPEDAIEAAGTDKPRRIMYPHFSTAKIHSDYVDKVAFHGDYIISKSANENIIVLWMIQNFNSKNPPPPLDAAPTTHEYRDTRSAFGGTFERILQFSSPGTDPFFMRFGFFAEPFMHPMLAIGTWEGKILLWDLKVIEQKGVGPGLGVAKRDSSTPSENGASLAGGGKPGRKDDISDLFGKIAAHATRMLPRKIPIRYISWSPNGEYMVAVAHQSTIFILKRW